MASRPRLGLWRRFVRWGDHYFAHGWPLVVYHPILLAFLWGAAIRTFSISGDLPIENVFGTHAAYHLWLGLGLVGPLFVAPAWLFIYRLKGRYRVFGFGLRLSGDLAVFFFVLAYHITTVLTNPINESRVVSRYIVAGALVFLLEVLVRDGWAIRLNEKRTKKVIRGRE